MWILASECHVTPNEAWNTAVEDLDAMLAARETYLADLKRQQQSRKGV